MQKAAHHTSPADDIALGEWSTDELEQLLVAAEAHIARERALQAALITELDRRQVATSDGARTLADWLAARLDVTHHTAKTLVRTARQFAVPPHPDPDADRR